MPSFDIVSKIDIGEMKNVINQAQREITGRYDFKGSKISLELKTDTIELSAEDDYKMKAALDILRTKMAKRDMGMNTFEVGDIKPAGNQMLKQTFILRQGIDKENGKKINKMAKESKLKISSSIMDDKIRVTGKKIDDLQKFWQMVRSNEEIKLELQMENMKS